MHNYQQAKETESERSERPDNRRGEVTSPLQNIGVDTGGTFTDIVMRIDGDLFIHKVLSTPQNPRLRCNTRRE